MEKARQSELPTRRHNTHGWFAELFTDAVGHPGMTRAVSLHLHYASLHTNTLTLYTTHLHYTPTRLHSTLHTHGHIVQLSMIPWLHTYRLQTFILYCKLHYMYTAMAYVHSHHTTHILYTTHLHTSTTHLQTHTLTHEQTMVNKFTWQRSIATHYTTTDLHTYTLTHIFIRIQSWRISITNKLHT